MKKLFFVFIVFALAFFGCSDDPVGTTFAEDNYQPKGAVVSANDVSGCFLTDPNASTVTFNVDSEGEEVNSANIIASYNGGGNQILSSVSTLPGPVEIAMPDLLSALSVTDVSVGDLVTIGFEAVTSTGEYRSSNPLNFNVGCASSLGGNHTYVSTNLVAANSPTPCPSGEVTGTVTFFDLGCGVYGVSDLGFGQYESSCWSDAPATDGGVAFTDICGLITVSGMDQYELPYSWIITSVSGPELSISWSNTYGDSGDVVITREGGTDWPEITTN